MKEPNLSVQEAPTSDTEVSAITTAGEPPSVRPPGFVPEKEVKPGETKESEPRPEKTDKPESTPPPST
jgi:hypothetical protein